MKGSITAGVFFIIVGIVFLLDAAGVWSVPSGYIIPALVIGLGVALLVSGTADRSEHD
jgi:fucose permease